MTRAGALIRAIIAEEGPIGLERFMGLALAHPACGYYATRDPLGTAGDFTTAPEISQMFGELVGLWAAEVWRAMGAPSPVRLVELGPGRGTLMADALRAAAAVPAFRAALDLHFVEVSPVLRDLQVAAMARAGATATWHADVGGVPAGPAIVIANEFFDALPVRHYVRTARGWCERLVGLSGDALVFGLAPDPDPSLRLAAPAGTALELGFAARAVMRSLSLRLMAEGGALLAIDYGHAGPRFGETLQAVRRHAPVDPLAEPGEADLTAHVDFAALAAAAREAGAVPHGPVAQGAWLRRLGIESRAAALKRRAAPAQVAAVDAALGRLTDAGTSDRPGMGALFKVLAVTARGLGTPPGFEEGDTA